MDVWLVLFVSTAFVSVAGITFSVGHLVTSRNRLQRRLPAGALMSDASALTSPGDDAAPWRESLSKKIDLALARSSAKSSG